jgi:hypothetical protein
MAFLAPLDVRRFRVGKVMEKRLNDRGIRTVGWRATEGAGCSRTAPWAWHWESRGLDAGAWFDSDIGEDDGPRS